VVADVKETFREKRARTRLMVYVFGGPGLLLAGAALMLAWAFPLLRPAIAWIGLKLRDLIDPFIRTGLNLLTVFENDIASCFLLMEDCLRRNGALLVDGDILRIGDSSYARYILTPLMMDFGYKSAKAPGASGERRFRYDKLAGKPIVEQVVDVFRAIRVYTEAESTDDLESKFEGLTPGTARVFEIYPFLGVNPANYTFEKLDKMLAKYFDAYVGKRQALKAVMGTFDGKIENLGVHAFAGIKVYPPLGFDPWPDDPAALEKVERLYACCVQHDIPMTTHGGAGGFATLRGKRLANLTSMAKWQAALGAYPELRLDIAHLPMRKPEHERRRQLIGLILDHPNVYTDISYRACRTSYYEEFARFLASLTDEERRTVESRIMFGTDFGINLLHISSYSAYVRLFSETKCLSGWQKHAFCSVNPQHFLFPGDT